MKISVLLIDDDYSTNLYHEIILNESACIERLDIKETTDDALQFLKSITHLPDVILLDINMPIKSGWDFLDEYGNIVGNHQMPLMVILSTTKMDEDIERANRNPYVDLFDTKPLTLHKIEKYLNHPKIQKLKNR